MDATQNLCFLWEAHCSLSGGVGMELGLAWPPAGGGQGLLTLRFTGLLSTPDGNEVILVMHLRRTRTIFPPPNP